MSQQFNIFTFNLVTWSWNSYTIASSHPECWWLHFMPYLTWWDTVSLNLTYVSRPFHKTFQSHQVVPNPNKDLNLSHRFWTSNIYDMYIIFRVKRQKVCMLGLQPTNTHKLLKIPLSMDSDFNTSSKWDELPAHQQSYQIYKRANISCNILC